MMDPKYLKLVTALMTYSPIKIGCTSVSSLPATSSFFYGMFTVSPHSKTISSRLSAALVPKQVRDNTQSLHSDRQCQMPVIILEPSMNCELWLYPL